MRYKDMEGNVISMCSHGSYIRRFANVNVKPIQIDPIPHATDSSVR